MKKIVFGLLILGLSISFAQSADVNTYVNLYNSLSPVPLITATNPNFSYDDAYQFQDAFVQALINSGEELSGYKLGLIGEKKPFGATETVYGRIFKSQEVAAGEIYSSDFVKPLIEVELAFKFSKDVSFPITFSELRDSIEWVAPAIELPDLVFDDMKNLSWLDLVALDVAPRQYIIGNHVALSSVDLDTINITAYHNGEVVKQAPSPDQMGLLMYLAAKLNSQMRKYRQLGSPLYKIQAGHIVITGAIGGIMPGKPGSYQINYGPLGNIDFEIVSTGK